jgi:hypothetical protein
MDASELYISEDSFARIYAVYEEVRDRLLGMLNEITGASEFMASSSTNSISPSIAMANIAKLPHINLPSFSGRHEDWESFKDLFSSLVHDVAILPESTKLQYLKSCLSGQAAELVKNIATTSANNSTWQALEMRYYNPLLGRL